MSGQSIDGADRTIPTSDATAQPLNQIQAFPTQVLSFQSLIHLGPHTTLLQGCQSAPGLQINHELSVTGAVLIHPRCPAKVAIRSPCSGDAKQVLQTPLLHHWTRFPEARNKWPIVPTTSPRWHVIDQPCRPVSIMQLFFGGVLTVSYPIVELAILGVE